MVIEKCYNLEKRGSVIELNKDLNNFKHNNSSEQSNNNSSPTNSIISTSENNDDNNTVNNDKDTLKQICTILSVIVAVLGFGEGIISIIKSFTTDGIEFFGPLFNIFVLFGGIACIICTIVIIVVIWIIYEIINH